MAGAGYGGRFGVAHGSARPPSPQGFSVISAQNYELVVPQTWPEVLFSIVCVFVQIVIVAYILGTANHYLIKKDPRMEAQRKQLRSLERYCAQRNLPASLRTRLRGYFEFQQTKQRNQARCPLRTHAAAAAMHTRAHGGVLVNRPL